MERRAIEFRCTETSCMCLLIKSVSKRVGNYSLEITVVDADFAGHWLEALFRSL